MADPPRFTILCATYNQAGYLAEMIGSATAQDFDDYEVVLVDDGSTDDTPDLLRRLLDELPAEDRRRFTVERTENRGQTAAFERGFALSRGEYICLLDSDDRFLRHKLTVLDESATQHPEAGMLMHPLRVVDASGKPTGIVRPKTAALSHGDVRAQMARNARHSAPGASGLVFRRDVMAKMFPAPTKRFTFAADAYLSFGAACLAPVVALDQALADYRMQPGGQYFKRMVSREGLRRQVDFQEVVAGHFGLERAARRNSHFARNRYASAMYDEPFGTLLKEFVLLVVATATDPFFRPRHKVALTAFWTVTLLAGRAWFPALWGWFQRRQTGWDRAAVRRPSPRRTAATG